MTSTPRHMKATFIKYTCIYLIAQRGNYEGNAIDRSESAQP